MDEQSKSMLDEILAQEPAALTDADKAFLRARRSYLSEEQKAVYAEVLAEQPEAGSSEADEKSEAEGFKPEAPKRGHKTKTSAESEV